MSLTQHEAGIESILGKIDTMAVELQILRRQVEQLLSSEEIRPGGAGTQPLLRSVVDVLEEAPGHRIFHSSDDVDHYLDSERQSWAS
ncbi:MAG: hypothetical protein KDE20_18070 [Caldilineaceae bacterium]|nr:hypothetical protein [Caldilineaceae bacterium]MCB9160473.1 hypothetical protein [Caldilineaceae bacterium]